MSQTCEFCGRSSGMTGSLMMADLSSCSCGLTYCHDCKESEFEPAGGGRECPECEKFHAL
ncbi:hypothetical protein BRD17_01950 [Halobacteriales archaeon SW_7_68_16]|nr:MAG: hypothetical protein BRD17_01950 [Halobacteriales archaeon SW_7_68_16]